MSRIDELIAELCPNGVEFKALGDVCDIKTGALVSKQAIDASPGPYPVINSGREPLGYISKFNTDDDPLGITSRGAGVGSITWCEGRYFRGNLNYAASIRDRNQIEIRYLFHVLLHLQPEVQQLATFQGIPALNKSSLARLRIPVPPLEVQREIVRVLDQFTALEAELAAELEAELEARRRQYEHYRDHLFTYPGGVQHAALGDVGEFIRGNGLQKSDLTDSGFPAIHYGQLHTFYGAWAIKTRSFTDPERVARLRKAKPGDLLIATTSEDDAALAKATAWIGDTDVVMSSDAYIFRHRLDPKFVAYFFGSEIFQRQKGRHITGTKVRRISGSALAKIKIPLPPLAEQERIVATLDAFDALVNDLSVGLPAELAARRKQYEHYRDRLLTFDEAV